MLSSVKLLLSKDIYILNFVSTFYFFSSIAILFICMRFLLSFRFVSTIPRSLVIRLHRNYLMKRFSILRLICNSMSFSGNFWEIDPCFRLSLRFEITLETLGKFCKSQNAPKLIFFIFIDV